ncbi:hypothetical protein KI387_016768, partial [Taxus chinensis]
RHDNGLAFPTLTLTKMIQYMPTARSSPWRPAIVISEGSMKLSPCTWSGCSKVILLE